MRASKTQRAAVIAAEKWASARGMNIADVPLLSRPEMLADIVEAIKLPESVVRSALLREWKSDDDIVDEARPVQQDFEEHVRSPSPTDPPAPKPS